MRMPGARGSGVASGMAVLCAVHCVALPLLAGSTTLINLEAWENPWIEGGFLGFTALVGLATLGPAFRRHGQLLPLALFAVGLSAMLASHHLLPEPLGMPLTVIGALFAVGAQVANGRFQQSCCFRETCRSEV